MQRVPREKGKSKGDRNHLRRYLNITGCVLTGVATFLPCGHSSVIQRREVFLERLRSVESWECGREASRQKSCSPRVFRPVEKTVKTSYKKVWWVLRHTNAIIFIRLLPSTWRYYVVTRNEASIGQEPCLMKSQIFCSGVSLSKSLYPFHFSFYFQMRSS